MKLAIGYATGFFVMTVFVAIIVAVTIWVGIGFLSFMFWVIPADLPFWGIIRFSVGVGALFGMFFCFSSDGKLYAQELADWLEAKGWLK